MMRKRPLGLATALPADRDKENNPLTLSTVHEQAEENEARPESPSHRLNMGDAMPSPTKMKQEQPLGGKRTLLFYAESTDTYSDDFEKMTTSSHQSMAERVVKMSATRARPALAEIQQQQQQPRGGQQLTASQLTASDAAGQNLHWSGSNLGGSLSFGNVGGGTAETVVTGPAVGVLDAVRQRRATGRFAGEGDVAEDQITVDHSVAMSKFWNSFTDTLERNKQLAIQSEQFEIALLKGTTWVFSTSNLQKHKEIIGLKIAREEFSRRHGALNGHRARVREALGAAIEQERYGTCIRLKRNDTELGQAIEELNLSEANWRKKIERNVGLLAAVERNVEKFLPPMSLPVFLLEEGESSLEEGEVDMYMNGSTSVSVEEGVTVGVAGGRRQYGGGMRPGSSRGQTAGAGAVYPPSSGGGAGGLPSSAAASTSGKNKQAEHSRSRVSYISTALEGDSDSEEQPSSASRFVYGNLGVAQGVSQQHQQQQRPALAGHPPQRPQSAKVNRPTHAHSASASLSELFSTSRYQDKPLAWRINKSSASSRPVSAKAFKAYEGLRNSLGDNSRAGSTSAGNSRRQASLERARNAAALLAAHEVSHSQSFLQKQKSSEFSQSEALQERSQVLSSYQENFRGSSGATASRVYMNGQIGEIDKIKTREVHEIQPNVRRERMMMGLGGHQSSMAMSSRMSTRSGGRRPVEALPAFNPTGSGNNFPLNNAGGMNSRMAQTQLLGNHLAAAGGGGGAGGGVQQGKMLPNQMREHLQAAPRRPGSAPGHRRGGKAKGRIYLGTSRYDHVKSRLYQPTAAFLALEACNKGYQLVPAGVQSGGAATPHGGSKHSGSTPRATHALGGQVGSTPRQHSQSKHSGYHDPYAKPQDMFWPRTAVSRSQSPRMIQEQAELKARSRSRSNSARSRSREHAMTGSGGDPGTSSRSASRSVSPREVVGGGRGSSGRHGAAGEAVVRDRDELESARPSPATPVDPLSGARGGDVHPPPTRQELLNLKERVEKEQLTLGGEAVVRTPDFVGTATAQGLLAGSKQVQEQVLLAAAKTPLEESPVVDIPGVRLPAVAVAEETTTYAEVDEDFLAFDPTPMASDVASLRKVLKRAGLWERLREEFGASCDKLVECPPFAWFLLALKASSITMETTSDILEAAFFDDFFTAEKREAYVDGILATISLYHNWGVSLRRTLLPTAGQLLLLAAEGNRTAGAASSDRALVPDMRVRRALLALLCVSATREHTVAVAYDVKVPFSPLQVRALYNHFSEFDYDVLKSLLRIPDDLKPASAENLKRFHAGCDAVVTAHGVEVEAGDKNTSTAERTRESVFLLFRARGEKLSPEKVREILSAASAASSFGESVIVSASEQSLASSDAEGKSSSSGGVQPRPTASLLKTVQQLPGVASGSSSDPGEEHLGAADTSSQPRPGSPIFASESRQFPDKPPSSVVSVVESDTDVAGTVAPPSSSENNYGGAAVVVAPMQAEASGSDSGGGSGRQFMQANSAKASSAASSFIGQKNEDSEPDPPLDWLTSMVAENRGGEEEGPKKASPASATESEKSFDTRAKSFGEKLQASQKNSVSKDVLAQSSYGHEEFETYEDEDLDVGADVAEDSGAIKPAEMNSLIRVDAAKAVVSEEEVVATESNLGSGTEDDVGYTTGAPVAAAAVDAGVLSSSSAAVSESTPSQEPNDSAVQSGISSEADAPAVVRVAGVLPPDRAYHQGSAQHLSTTEGAKAFSASSAASESSSGRGGNEVEVEDLKAAAKGLRPFSDAGSSDLPVPGFTTSEEEGAGKKNRTEKQAGSANFLSMLSNTAEVPEPGSEQETAKQDNLPEEKTALSSERNSYDDDDFHSDLPLPGQTSSDENAAKTTSPEETFEMRGSVQVRGGMLAGDSSSKESSSLFGGGGASSSGNEKVEHYIDLPEKEQVEAALPAPAAAKMNITDSMNTTMDEELIPSLDLSQQSALREIMNSSRIHSAQKVKYLTEWKTRKNSVDSATQEVTLRHPDGHQDREDEGEVVAAHGTSTEDDMQRFAPTGILAPSSLVPPAGGIRPLIPPAGMN
eukprot:g12350.t1